MSVSEHPAPPPAPRPPSPLSSLISGGCGGVCLVLAGQPFDLIKVRLQTAAPGVYSGAGDALRRTLASEGVRGLYRGMAAPLAGVTPIFALCFWAFEAAQSALRAARGLAPGARLSLADVGQAGAASAQPTTLIMAPGERVKCILQVQGGGGGGASAMPRFDGPAAVARHLLAHGGVRSLYRGAAATLARDGVGSVAYFAVYEAIKRQLTPAGATGLSPLAVVLGGGFAGVCNWLVALPIDVVKSRIQTHDVLGGAPGADGSRMLATARAIVAERGLAGLYRGATPALLRAFPANAACFAGIEASKMALQSVGW